MKHGRTAALLGALAVTVGLLAACGSSLSQTDVQDKLQQGLTEQLGGEYTVTVTGTVDGVMVSAMGSFDVAGCFMASDCNDNNACTTDTCDPVAGVKHTPVNQDDNDVCTADSCDAATGVCSNPAKCGANQMCDASSGICSSNVPTGKLANVTNKTTVSQEIKIACDGTSPDFTTTKKSVVIGAGATFTFSGGMNFCWGELVITTGTSWNDLGTFPPRLAKWQETFTVTDGSGQTITVTQASSPYDVLFATK